MPAPWTEPRTWSFEEVVTAAQLNEQIRDNLKHIGPDSGTFLIRRVEDIRWHGAVGDGTTNDRSAIQDAVDAAGAGGVVYIPRGVYRCDTTRIDLPSNITIVGEGRYASVLNPDVPSDYEPSTSGTHHPVIQATGTETVPLSNITIRDIGIKQDLIAGPAHRRFGHILFTWCNGIEVRGLWRRSGSAGVLGKNCSDAQVSDVHADVSRSSTVEFRDSTYVAIHNIVKDGGDAEAVDSSNVTGLVISNVVGEIDDRAGEMIDLGAVKDAIVSNCVSRNYEDGVTLKTENSVAWNNVRIADCHFLNCSDYAITVRAGLLCEDLVIDGCILDSPDAGDRAIHIQSQSSDASTLLRRMTVENCRIKAGRYAIYTSESLLTNGVEDMFIRNNRIESAEHAIFCDPSGTDGSISGLTIVGNTILVNDLGQNGIRTVEVENLTVERNDITSDGACIKTFSGAGRTRVRRNTLESTSEEAVSCGGEADLSCDENEVVNASTLAIEAKNCGRPRVRWNNVQECNSHAIDVIWTNTDQLDSTNNIVGAIVDGNTIRNWGTGGGSLRRGIRLFLDTITGTYNLVTLRGNTVWLDADVSDNSHKGIVVDTGDLDALDYVKLDDNLVYDVSTPIGTGTLGANSTQDNNTTKTAA